jgi:hypothetical protein
MFAREPLPTSAANPRKVRRFQNPKLKIDYAQEAERRHFMVTDVHSAEYQYPLKDTRNKGFNHAIRNERILLCDHSRYRFA